MNKKIIIYGGEGNGGVVASCIEDNRNHGDMEYKVYGFLNDFLKPSEKINGYPVLGNLNDTHKFLDDPNNYFVWAIHMIGKGQLRENLFNKINLPIEKLATIIHKTAFVADNAILDPGVFVMSNSYIGPMAKIGYGTLIMANCLIGHNTEVGPLCHFSIGSITSSYVKIGKSSDIALGAKIIEKVTIGDYSVAGASSLVLKEIKSKEIHVGIPAQFLRMIK